MRELDELLELGVREKERGARVLFANKVRRELHMDRLAAEGQSADYQRGWTDGIARALERLGDFENYG